MKIGLLSNLSTAFRYPVPNLTKPQAIGRSIKVCNCSASGLKSKPKKNSTFVSRAFSMATSGTKAGAGDLVVDSLISSCGNVPNITLSSGVYFANRSFRYCQKATLGLKNRATIRSHIVNSPPRTRRLNSLAVTLFSALHTSSVHCCSEGTVPGVSLDSLAYDEPLKDSAVFTDQTLKLQSGSCYLPHPDKEKTGGEDAHFICEDQQAIGVADGVGGWAEVGVDAGIFARELMLNSVAAIQDEPEGAVDPSKVLEKAHSATNEKGSSTACIITLTKQNLHAINLGDSGFIVIRDGSTIFESPVQQHGFNFTYQLESGKSGDLPSSGQVFMIPVISGDVIVAGTDGLFDNLYSSEITAVVVRGLSTGFPPRDTAQQIAILARERALDRKRQTPFSTAAQEAGYHYYGGKLDDTTVVVSYITSSTTV